MTFPRKKALMVTPKFYGYGGLLIGGILRSSGCTVDVTRDLTKVTALSRKADLVCLSLHSTTDLIDLENIIGQLKGGRSRLVIAGGPAVQDVEFASRVLPSVDVFVLGEGEETIVDLLHAKNKDDLETIRGIAFRRGQGIIKTLARKAPKLSGRPLPIVPQDLSRHFIRKVNVYVEVCRGCRGNCVFCQYCHMFGHEIRNRPMADILKEARYFKRHGIRKMALSGGDVSKYGLSSSRREENFVNLTREVSRVVGKNNLAGPDIRPDSISPAILECVRKYTQGWIFVGIESGSERILNFVKKNVKTDEVQSNMNMAKKHRVNVLGSFMVGFINEQHSDFLETKHLVEHLHLDKYSVNLAEPLPGTPYWELTRNCQLSQNPLFAYSDKTMFDARGLTIAEYRALTLYASIYRMKHGNRMNRNTFKRRLRAVREEAERIQAIIKELKRLD